MMKNSIQSVFIVMFTISAVSMPVFTYANTFEKIFYLSNGKKGTESFKKNADKIDILAPQAYTLSATLQPSGSVSAEIKRIAFKRGLKIMPLIVNNGFKQDVIHNLLISATAQDHIINFMMQEAVRNDFIGWQLDFENINVKDKNLYSTFVEKTARAFKEKNLILSIAAVARKSDYEDSDFFLNWSGVFDYERLAKTLDFISIMTYDDPDSKSSPATIPFVKEILWYLKDKIPPQKLSLGIPLYYWGWSIEPLKRIRTGGTYERIKLIKTLYPYLEGFDDNKGVPWLFYRDGERRYMIWFENKKSFGNRIAIIADNKLRGFSAWALGMEDPTIWDSFHNN